MRDSNQQSAISIHHSAFSKGSSRFAGSYFSRPQARPEYKASCIRFDAEADYLEVQSKCAPGYMKETAPEALMERIDADGNIIGFSILGVSRFTKDKPLEAELTAA